MNDVPTDAPASDLEQRVLVILGYHEKDVMDKILDAAIDEYKNGDYLGVVLTGTSEYDPGILSFIPVPNEMTVHGDEVTEEILYMRNRISRYNLNSPEKGTGIIDYIPAQSAMGNIRNTLSKMRPFPGDITFFIDRSQSCEVQEFLRYFSASKNVHVKSPEVSFREGSCYGSLTKIKDRIYPIVLSIPVISDVFEAICGNARIMDKVRSLKNRTVNFAGQYLRTPD